MNLHHPSAECAGSWVRTASDVGTAWRCTRCGATHPGDDVAAREAIWREYEMDLLFFRLGAQGRLLMTKKKHAGGTTPRDGG